MIAQSCCAPCSHVVEVIGQAQTAGLNRIGFVADAPATPPPAPIAPAAPGNPAQR